MIDAYRKESPIGELKRFPALADTSRWLDIYFCGQDPGYIPLLAPKATVFQRNVWDFLLTIPFGHTVTYGEIARHLGERFGKPVSPRAVGGAVSHNPISLIIPCHRVVGAGGRLTGYAGGIENKIKLLELEYNAVNKKSDF